MKNIYLARDASLEPANLFFTEIMLVYKDARTIKIQGKANFMDS